MEGWKTEVDVNYLTKEFPLIRKRFFDESLFSTGEKVAIKQKHKNGSRLLQNTLNCGVALGMFVLLFYFLPQTLMRFFPGIATNLIKAEETKRLKNTTETNTSIEQIILTELPEQLEESDSVIDKKIKPKYDLNAPIGQWLEIPSVEIKSELLTTTTLDDKKEVNKILDKGIYVYPENKDYGNPAKMTILAGHHYNMWTSEKQNSRSFQKLNEVNIGDLVTITDNQKQWTYKVYKIVQGSTIEDQEADLLMYTCVFWWNSDLRLFVYANLETN